jgi:alpha-beta hydrolase superfamily lysophospholipase
MSKDKPVKRSRFVLVHSAWLGGWAWGHVASILEQEGHEVVAPDLPAHGKDKTPPSQVTLIRTLPSSPTSSTRIRSR